MIRVLMISKACLVGAYQTKLEAIAAHDDIDLTVIVPPSWNDPSGTITLERSHTEGYRLLVDPIRFNGSYHFYSFPTLSRRLRETAPDVLHIDEEPYNVATWLALRAARRHSRGRRPIRTLFFSWQNIARRYPLPFRLLESAVLRQIDYAVVGNVASGEVWRSKGYAGPLRVIPQFGVSLALFRPNPRPPDNRFIIGSAGRRLVPEKGLDLLLRAAARLDGDWQVRLAGDGPERPALEQLARDLGIAERVEFSGNLASHAVAAYLQQLDTLVLPSRTLPNWKEQFGRVLIEAMACAVPVVGSDSGEIPHVIGDAGLVFPEDDVDALHAHLHRLMHDDAFRHTLGAAGRRRVADQYTQTRIAAQTVAVYRALMANP